MDLDHLQLFLDELILVGIFEQRAEYTWFRHELAQYCISNKLDLNIKKAEHKYAADFFLKEFNHILSPSSDIKAEEEMVDLEIRLGCAYHLHESGQYKESLDFNRRLADYASRIGELDLAERCYLRAIKDSANLTDEQSRMDLILNLTKNVYYTWGRYDECISNYNLLWEYYSKAEDQRGIGVTFLNLGKIYFLKGELDAALEKYNESLDIAMKLGDQEMIAANLQGIGLIHHDKGEYNQALEKLNQSLEIRRKLGDSMDIAETLENLGILLTSTEKYKDAIPYLVNARNIFDKLKFVSQRQRVLRKIEEILDKIGEKEFEGTIQS